MTTTLSDLPSARAAFHVLSTQAQACGLHLRPPPPEPTSCCGRGCSCCVWESFYIAADWWVEQAQDALSTKR